MTIWATTMLTARGIARMDRRSSVEDRFANVPGHSQCLLCDPAVPIVLRPPAPLLCPPPTPRAAILGYPTYSRSPSVTTTCLQFISPILLPANVLPDVPLR